MALVTLGWIVLFFIVRHYKKQTISGSFYSPPKIVLELIKEDFNNSCFVDVTDCPLARAIKRTFYGNPNLYINVNTESVLIRSSYPDSTTFSESYSIIGGFGRRQFEDSKEMVQDFRKTVSVVLVKEEKEVGNGSI